MADYFYQRIVRYFLVMITITVVGLLLTMHGELPGLNHRGLTKSMGTHQMDTHSVKPSPRIRAYSRGDLTDIPRCPHPSRPLTSYPQVTYLCSHCMSVPNSSYPCVHMPAPRSDPKVTSFGLKDIQELEVIVGHLLEEEPTWEFTTPVDIVGVVGMFGRETFDNWFLDKVDRLVSFTNLSTYPVVLGDVQLHLGVLKDRVFPDKRRPLTCDNCFPYDFTNIISPKDVCNGEDTINFVAIVTTVPKNRKARQRVRNTWGSEYNKNKYSFKVIFLLGSGWSEDEVAALRAENDEHNDILMDNFVDSYYNLTQKVLMGFHWALRECPRAAFVMRGADDTWVSVPRLTQLLEENGRREAFQRYQVGNCFPAFVPHRALNGKGYLTTLEYDLDVFPPYALGTVYLTSMTLTRDLVAVSPHVPYLPIEDAYFGLALAQLGSGCHHIRNMDGSYTSHQPLW